MTHTTLTTNICVLILDDNTSFILKIQTPIIYYLILMKCIIRFMRR